MVANDNNSEDIIQRRPDENRVDDEDTETMVKSIVKDGIDDNSSIETDIIEIESLVAGTDRELSEGGGGEINDVDMENSLSLNEIIGTLVGDEVITTEGAKENEELSVCSGDGYESSVEILDTNSDVDVKIVGQFISAKEARKLKKKKRKLERRSRLNPPPNLDGKITCNNGLNCRQGVAVLSNNYCKDKIQFVYSDEKGRFLHVTFLENEKLYNIISLYAPNTVTERTEFFEFVKLYTENMDNLIIGGDFNTSLSNLDRGGKTKHIVDEPCRKLYEIVNDHNQSMEEANR
ncbi:unnamed protein product [Mytilus edulis]|uniref:Endonuclease/exonuclease/phosphatase domain-containing protein n=1 Tax=Mytilus edulis TaxID=6550 RepID=A0A8S3U3P8_MYTED|nr:unnamed protein product [Mytilus edulis]